MQIPKLREWRERRALTQVELAERAGVSERSVAGYEAGGGARLPTVRRLAEALGIEVTDLYGDSEHPLGTAPPSPEQPRLNGFEDERLANWRTAVADAQRLRESGRAQMEELLAAWQTSRQRGELRSARRGYRDEMAQLLNKAYGAQHRLAAFLFAEGGIPAPDDWEEVRAADRFYWTLIEMMRNEGFRVQEHASEPPEVEEPAA